MELHKEPVLYRYPGPFPDCGLPADVLYDARITFTHEAGHAASAQLQDALAPLSGALERRGIPFYGVRLRAQDGRMPFSGRVTRDQVRLALGHRIKAKHLERLIERLGQVEGASHLEITGTVTRFHEAYAGVGPCTPCAAGRYPRNTRR